MEAKHVVWKIHNNIGSEARRHWMVLLSIQLKVGMHKQRLSSHCMLGPLAQGPSSFPG